LQIGQRMRGREVQCSFLIGFAIQNGGHLEDTVRKQGIPAINGAAGHTPILSYRGMRCYSQGELLIRGRKAPISMGIRPRQSGAKLTFLTWLSPTGGAANRQRLFLTYFHSCIMLLLLDSKLVNSDQGVAGLLIPVWSEASAFARAFAKPLKKKMPSKFAPLW
jgi:hypothetical protein